MDLQVREIDPDGNCLFRSIAYLKYGTEENHEKVRKRCINYIKSHPEKYLDYMDSNN
jgi:hypothetical protein